MPLICHELLTLRRQRRCVDFSSASLAKPSAIHRQSESCPARDEAALRSVIEEKAKVSLASFAMDFEVLTASCALDPHVVVVVHGM
jgi:hypothetical protein